MMKKLATLITFIAFQLHVYSQKIDSIYIETNQLRSLVLPEKIIEISALEFDQQSTPDTPLFWALNDSHNANEIYLFDGLTGEVTNTVILDGVPNTDWEEITQDEDFIYVGDFGNNLGNRKDLTIYTLDKNLIDYSKATQTVTVDKIEFYYPEQDTFKIKNRKNDYDLEAFFAYNGKLHLFSKEWASLKTTHYTLDPKIKEKQAAKKINTFHTQFLVTAAHISEHPATKGVYLLGYTKEGIAFINWYDLEEGNEDFLSAKNIKVIPFGFASDLGQLEGISVNPQRNEVCASGEELNFRGMYAKQQLHCFPANLLIK
ncbi:hypothetical protein [Vaginella massiliensis]|uniref:hypothetical protein n=1 Tax=Vaginella massiliensis TaxID=1816680 RepID=UPI000839787D|nr:hypothetical protein [Vaginella massiliensis]